MVVGRANDQVRLADDAPLVGDVVMRECAARRLDGANPLARGLARDSAHVRIGDLGILSQLEHPLTGKEHLDQARPVSGQCGVHGLGPHIVVELFVCFLRQGGSHAIGRVEPSQRGGTIDAAIRAVSQPLPADLLQVREL